MTESSTKKSGAFPRIVGILLMLAGAVMLVAGGIAWGTISGQLKAENMTVPDDAPSNAGKVVAGPFTAWSQQEIISIHANGITEGRSYAELGTAVNEAKEQYGEDSEEAAALQGIRNTAMNASLLRTSLFASILSFGVAFLVMGLGISTGLTGAAFYQIGRMKDV